MFVSKVPTQKSGCALFIDHFRSFVFSVAGRCMCMYILCMSDSCQHFFLGLFICALFNAQFIYQLTDSDSEAYHQDGGG